MSEETPDKRNLCGWCITGHHSDCRVEVGWYGRVWACGCACPKDESKRLVHTVNAEPSKKARRKRTPSAIVNITKSAEQPPAPTPKPVKRTTAAQAKVTKVAQEILDEVLSSDEVKADREKWSSGEGQS